MVAELYLLVMAALLPYASTLLLPNCLNTLLPYRSTALNITTVYCTTLPLYNVTWRGRGHAIASLPRRPSGWRRGTPG
eukprot:scaffold107890_cov27-Phaeocystis_antarctica.AAC.2